MQFRWPLAPVLFLVTWMSSGPSWAQGTDPCSEQKPEFDAVSIRQIDPYQRISSPGSTAYIFARHQPCVYSEDKVTCQLGLAELIREAYQRKRYEVIGPNWLMEDVFVFQAVLGEKTSKEVARQMLRRALEDRFGLQCHIEKKLLPVYEMIIGPGGLHLTQADPPGKQKMLVLDGRQSASMVRSAGKFSAVDMALDEFGYWVGNTAGLNRPVLNGTGLKERYKIDLHWYPSDDTDSSKGLKDPAMVPALKRQTGLVLHKKDTAVDVLVIDKVNRTPTAN